MTTRIVSAASEPKTIAVISDLVARSGRVPFRGRASDNGPAWWQLIRHGRQLGLSFVLARRSDWDGQSSTLRRAFTHDDRHWVRIRAVPFDALMPRVALGAARTPPLVYWNDARVWRLCSDKWLTATFFRAESPATWRVASRSQIDQIRRQHPADTFVLKPRLGSHSRGVVLLRPASRTPALASPHLLQSFIRGGGFLGRTGVWDLRCYVQDGRIDAVELKHGSTRQPILDTHRGARLVRLSLARLPAGVRHFVHRIDGHFTSILPRHYCVDLRYDEQGRPRLIELNHNPALPRPGPDSRIFYDHLCRMVRRQLVAKKKRSS